MNGWTAEAAEECREPVQVVVIPKKLQAPGTNVLKFFMAISYKFLQ
jgi:hypothetical protein